MKLRAEEIATAVQAQRLTAAASIVPSGYSIDSRTLGRRGMLHRHPGTQF